MQSASAAECQAICISKMTAYGVISDVGNGESLKKRSGVKHQACSCIDNRIERGGSGVSGSAALVASRRRRLYQNGGGKLAGKTAALALAASWRAWQR